jgi:2-polyprenyl-3-methyl-5-hydroxy-6-metoxy-1,4-benzoquinol methylase
MSYNTLLPLIKKTQSPLSPEEFQAIVNVVFHDFEASHYDAMHTDMWGSLQEQINLLVEDLFQHTTPSQNLHLLDIGCGTGLSTQILLNSKLGSHIDAVTLLDTSPNMLKYAEEKAKTWHKKYTLINDTISGLTEQYDVIIICSVLHHIPDLNAFLRQIDKHLKSGGILIHLQDPNGDYINDSEYLQRVAAYENERESLPKQTKLTDLVPKKWKQFLNRQLGRKNYIDQVNDKLIAEKAIKVRMTADEIWSVTDIHVETKQDSVNKGISLKFLQNQLPNFTLINQRSYGFYGELKSELTESYQQKEAGFIAANARNGRNISCLWVKK